MHKFLLLAAAMMFVIGCGGAPKDGVVPQRVVPPGPMMVTPPTPEPVAKQQVVVMDYWASWCAPCRRFSPTFDAWAKKYSKENVKFVKVNADEHKDLVQKYDVSALPTVVIEVDGKVVAKFVGAPREEQIVAHLPK